MKKLKILLACALSAVFACGMVALAGCGDDDEGKISDSEWSEYLNLDCESYDTFTMIVKQYSNYGKEEAKEYGKWYSYTDTIKIDNKNSVITRHATEQSYNSDANNGTGGFVTKYYETYNLLYGDKYYEWNHGGYEELMILERTKADFTQKLELYSLQITALQAYANLKSKFKYNSSTAMYEMEYLGVKVCIQFHLDGGLRILQQNNTLTTTEILVTGLNATEVSVPYFVYEDIDEFKAN